jgi:ribose/xylose/arabinose/galactoside ABC-type transport system permease subunit
MWNTTGQNETIMHEIGLNRQWIGFDAVLAAIFLIVCIKVRLNSKSPFLTAVSASLGTGYALGIMNGVLANWIQLGPSFNRI